MRDEVTENINQLRNYGFRNLYSCKSNIAKVNISRIFKYSDIKRTGEIKYKILVRSTHRQEVNEA